MGDGEVTVEMSEMIKIARMFRLVLFVIYATALIAGLFIFPKLWMLGLQIISLVLVIVLVIISKRGRESSKFMEIIEKNMSISIITPLSMKPFYHDGPPGKYFARGIIHIANGSVVYSCVFKTLWAFKEAVEMLHVAYPKLYVVDIYYCGWGDG